MIKTVLAKLIGWNTVEKSNWRKAIEKAHLEEAQDQVAKEKHQEGEEEVRHSQEVLRRAAEEARQKKQKETD